MAIDVLEIRDSSRELIGVIDTAKSVIWHSVYFGIGDFEIYAQLTPQHLAFLEIGNYVTRSDNDEVGIIEEINVSYSVQDGYMITASGRFAKSILDRRLIYKLSDHTNTPTILNGSVEIAARRLVLDNAIDCSFDSRRNIDVLGLGALANLPAIIVDGNGNAAQKQVSYQPLMSYTDEFLQEYGYAAKVILNASNKKLLYVVFSGTDRSTENTDGNAPVIFSTEYENLTSSDYSYNAQNARNAVLIGGEGEGLERFYSLLTAGKTGLQLREMWFDASSINKTYTDSNDEEQSYTDAEYKSMLDQAGKKQLAALPAPETFTGEINASFGNWIFGRDFFLGDLVTLQDNAINKYATVRIMEATEVQDENGYSVDVVYS
ncbi:MAG: siphovirus ReqiPepy6 Gp37-like family protein [Selenomonadaceae bacterium]|nr:siphovirus ReqiPepy6 Gp37-like family protein [Selenomonadaceae bacterium]